MRIAHLVNKCSPGFDGYPANGAEIMNETEHESWIPRSFPDLSCEIAGRMMDLELFGAEDDESMK